MVSPSIAIEGAIFSQGTAVGASAGALWRSNVRGGWGQAISAARLHEVPARPTPAMAASADGRSEEQGIAVVARIRPLASAEVQVRGALAGRSPPSPP